MKYTVDSLAVYKQKAALIRETGEKLTIDVAGSSPVRVREKDIEVLHPGPVKSFAELEGAFPEDFAGEVWELYVDAGETFTLQDIAELAGGWTAKNAWLAYQILVSDLYFEGTVHAIQARPRAELAVLLEKRNAKHAESELREAFLARFRSKKLCLPDDLRFLQDVEALAMGKSEKSRTLKDAGFEESPETAHQLLLECGVWDNFVNPYPSRFATLFSAPKCAVLPPPEGLPRIDLGDMAAFAIDDETSTDPDDAVSLEMTATGCILYVHVADPAASILPGSPADQEARERGATLYAPEGIARMLGEDALAYYALGITNRSCALTFKIELVFGDDEGDLTIKHTDIFRSSLHVTRLTYREASDYAALAPFYRLAEANLRRRIRAGALPIELPEVTISVQNREIELTPVEPYPSRSLVRECMLIAGEAAALWALGKRVAFPFINQETVTVPGNVLTGFAGAFQLRRCMRPRALSTKPGLHQGLGLDTYTQVTSPLRRYTDLLAHQQISAVLCGDAPLDEEQLLVRLAAAERAALAVTRAERASRAHWTAVFLSGKTGSLWEGVILEVHGPHAVVSIPALGLEVPTALPREDVFSPNSPCVLQLTAVNIPKQETRWILAKSP